jgi:hypothetical protein
LFAVLFAVLFAMFFTVVVAFGFDAPVGVGPPAFMPVGSIATIAAGVVPGIVLVVGVLTVTPFMVRDVVFAAGSVPVEVTSPLPVLPVVAAPGVNVGCARAPVVGFGTTPVGTGVVVVVAVVFVVAATAGVIVSVGVVGVVLVDALVGALVDGVVFVELVVGVEVIKYKPATPRRRTMTIVAILLAFGMVCSIDCVDISCKSEHEQRECERVS